VRESLPGAGELTNRRRGAQSLLVVTLSSPKSALLQFQKCLPRENVRAHTREFVSTPAEHQVLLQGPRLCRPTLRRQLTCSHGPVSTHQEHAAEKHSNWCMSLRVICASERTSERANERYEQPPTNTRPQCDLTLRWQKPQQGHLGPMNATGGANTFRKIFTVGIWILAHSATPSSRTTEVLRDFYTPFSGNCNTIYRDHIMASLLRLQHTTSPRFNHSLASQITRNTCANRMLSASISNFPSMAHPC
jgi:hypothetical protein